MSARPSPAVGPGRITHRTWFVLLLIVACTASLRARLLDVPLERDEGEYAYAGQLLLQGTPPYQGIYNMKMPGVYAAYALVLATLGQTTVAVHLGLLIVNLLSTLLVFGLGHQLGGARVALGAAAAFAWLSLGRHVHGTAANAEHFVMLFVLAGLVLLLRAGPRRGHLFAAAACLGVACVMKQHGVFFAVFAALVLIGTRPRSLSRATIFGAGVLLPVALTAAMLAAAGVFGTFWFWTVTYAREYAATQELAEGLGLFAMRMGRIVGSDAPLWILAAIGLGALWRRHDLRPWRVWLSGFTLASLAATCVGLYFRAHYFLYLLPAVALLAGLGVTALTARAARWRRSLATALIAAAILQGALRERDFLFRLAPEEVSRLVYQTNPFGEARVIGEYIREHSDPDDRVLVFGSEPEILFHARRRSATGYVYTYPLMEPHPFATRMQRQLIAEAEAARPRFLVVVDEPLSWLRREESSDEIFRWLVSWAGTSFRKVGVADIQRSGPTVYRFGEAARDYRPVGTSLVLYERN